MKTIRTITLMSLLLVCLCFTSCRRSTDEVWDDTKSAGRHMGRGMRTLGGKHGDSRQVRSRDEFAYVQEDPQGYVQEEYVPLPDQPYSNDVAMADFVAPPPSEVPGDPNSRIPGIEAFRDPNSDPNWQRVFRDVRFPYNGYLVRGDDQLETVRLVASYMRQYPNTYVFVAGHCDERGPQAYNLALGARRSNTVRNLLIQEGVNPDNIFTTSYGKDRPLALGHDEDSWAANRRAEFKVYQR